ncbi:hypothetical protein ACRAWD_19945 [Caulobacter segnis]
MLVLGLVVSLNGIRQALRARSRLTLLLSVWCLVTITAGVYDLSLQQNLVNIESVYLTNFTGVAVHPAVLVHHAQPLSPGAGGGDLGQGRPRPAPGPARGAELTASHARLREVEAPRTAASGAPAADAGHARRPGFHPGRRPAGVRGRPRRRPGRRRHPARLHRRPETDHRLHGAGRDRPPAAAGHLALPPAAAPRRPPA